MTRKDYIQIVNTIVDIIDKCKIENNPLTERQIDIIIERFCNTLKQDNWRFDCERFKKAIERK